MSQRRTHDDDIGHGSFTGCTQFMGLLRLFSVLFLVSIGYSQLWAAAKPIININERAERLHQALDGARLKFNLGALPTLLGLANMFGPSLTPQTNLGGIEYEKTYLQANYFYLSQSVAASYNLTCEQLIDVAPTENESDALADSYDELDICHYGAHYITQSLFREAFVVSF